MVATEGQVTQGGVEAFHGFRFAAHLRKHQGLRALDAVFAALPLVTFREVVEIERGGAIVGRF